MENINAVISIRQTSVGTLLRTVDALVGCSMTALIADAPEDCTDYVMRVFSHGGESFYDFPCSRIGNRGNSLKVTILGTAFIKDGTERYEIRAKDVYGNETGFGRGKIEILPFSTGTAQQLDGNRFVVDTLLDDDGAQHPIVACKDETGAWTYKFMSPFEAGTRERRRKTTILGDDGFRHPVVARQDEFGVWLMQFIKNGGGDIEGEKINLSAVLDDEGVFHSVEAYKDEKGVLRMRFRSEPWPDVENGGGGGNAHVDD